MNATINSSLALSVVAASRLFGHRQRAVPQRKVDVALATSQILGKGATLVLPQPLGHTIDCLSGAVWITHDGDIKDVILERGNSYRAERPARMLVFAISEAQLSLRSA